MTRKPSTKSESEPTSDILIPLTEDETLHVELEDGSIYLTLRSDGCIPLMKRSVEEAVYFTMPELTDLQHLDLSRQILDKIVSTLTPETKPTV